jgi:threonine/homoserine/homoserine lactone efflux protein
VALAIFGTALIVAGSFTTDPGAGYPPGVPTPAGPTPHGAVHALAGLFTFVSLGVGCFALARRFMDNRRWRGWAAYSILTGIVVVLSLVVSNVPSLVDFAGLIQRVGIISGWTWIVVLAAQLLRDMRPSIEQAASPDS